LPVLVSRISTGRASNHENRIENVAARVIVKRPDRKPRTQSEQQSGGDFYYLSTAYDQDEPYSGGRVIRVDMPRSSLFALGVNVPLENGPDVVKADLLIGPDGTTRAIRVVN
jgi:hypothetical protein